MKKEISQALLSRALRSAVHAGDCLELPVYIFGSKSNPEILYGMIIGTREMAIAVLSENDDLEITGMLKSQNLAEVEELN